MSKDIMSNKKNSTRIVLSIAGGIIIWLVLIVVGNVTGNNPGLNRLITVFGGSYSGYIQAICYAGAIYAILSLKELNTFIKGQFDGFALKLLPEEDQLILTPEEVADIKLSVIEIEKRGKPYLITKFIKNACTQYRNDQSIPDTMQVLDIQIDNAKNELDGKLSMIRYVISGIMSVGFIGTVIGLASAIGNANLAKTDDGLAILTSYLGIAFDTTLVALLLGLILNFSYHKFLEQMDVFFAKSKSYVVDNLVSRIYNRVD